MDTLSKETFVVEIKDLDKRGAGRAIVWYDTGQRQPKKIKLTVPRSLPGEKVKVTVTNPEKRKRATVYPEEILVNHPERTRPLCPHFDRCGGCVWQHWRYEGQLKQKTDHVKSALERHGFDSHLVFDTIGMDEPWQYRNKMEFTFSKDGELGLHEQGNFRKIIPLETCLIAGKEMVEAVMEVACWAREHKLKGYDKERHEGLLRNVMVRMAKATGEVMLAIFATEPPEGPLKETVDDLIKRITEKQPQVKSLLWMENTLWADRAQAEEVHILAGRDFIYDELAGYRYRLWHDTFFQTNPVQAEKLVELALEFAAPKNTETMIDLFCGVGTFSLPFARRVKKLYGVEIVETSVESARQNASDNGIDNAEFLAMDARRGFDIIRKQNPRIDLLLLDPPRSGAGGKVMRRIGRAQPERIVYVSCNPDTFAQDIAELVPFGYRLVKVQPVDLFPQTYHVECVALLVRSEK